MIDLTQTLTLSIKDSDQEHSVSLTMMSGLTVTEVLEWLPGAFHGLDFSQVGDELKAVLKS